MRGCVTMDRSWVVNFVNRQYQYLKSRRAKQAPYSFRTSEQGRRNREGNDDYVTAPFADSYSFSLFLSFFLAPILPLTTILSP